MDITKLWTQTHKAVNLHLSLNFSSNLLREEEPNQRVILMPSASAKLPRQCMRTNICHLNKRNFLGPTAPHAT